MNFVSCFAVEKDKIPAKLSRAMFKHHDFMHDVFDDAFLWNTPHVDVFTAGFPCQSFSAAGLQMGLFDHRGIVVLRIIMWICLKKPKVFILENVEGLVTRFFDVLSLILELLGCILLMNGTKAYSVVWRVLNSRKEGGVPQNRPRVFIVGVRVDVMVSPFTWPEPLHCRPLIEFLDGHGTLEGHKHLPGRLPTAPAAARKLVCIFEKITQRTGLHPLHSHFVASIGAARAHFMLGASPCITRGRGGSGGHWLTSKQRFMSIDEILRLQGVQDPGRIPRGTCTERQLGMVAGNAITVDLFARVLHNALLAAGLSQQPADGAGHPSEREDKETSIPPKNYSSPETHQQKSHMPPSTLVPPKQSSLETHLTMSPNPSSSSLNSSTSLGATTSATADNATCLCVETVWSRHS